MSALQQLSYMYSRPFLQQFLLPKVAVLVGALVVEKKLLAIYSKGLCHKSFLHFVTVLEFKSMFPSFSTNAMYLLYLSYLLINQNSLYLLSYMIEKNGGSRQYTHIGHGSSDKLELDDSCCLLWNFVFSLPSFCLRPQKKGENEFTFSKCMLCVCYLTVRTDANLFCQTY